MYFDTLLRPQGGVKSFVRRRVGEGIKVSDIAQELSSLGSEEISASRLYEWLRRWEQEEELVST